MATHSGILAWRIPWTEEPGGLQSMGLQRVRHDSSVHTRTHLPASGLSCNMWELCRVTKDLLLRYSPL